MKLDDRLKSDKFYKYMSVKFHGSSAFIFYVADNRDLDIEQTGSKLGAK
jgi:hypothetical protein